MHVVTRDAFLDELQKLAASGAIDVDEVEKTAISLTGMVTKAKGLLGGGAKREATEITKVVDPVTRRVIKKPPSVKPEEADALAGDFLEQLKAQGGPKIKGMRKASEALSYEKLAVMLGPAQADELMKALPKLTQQLVKRYPQQTIRAAEGVSGLPGWAKKLIPGGVRKQVGQAGWTAEVTSKGVDTPAEMVGRAARKKMTGQMDRNWRRAVAYDDWVAAGRPLRRAEDVPIVRRAIHEGTMVAPPQAALSPKIKVKRAG